MLPMNIRMQHGAIRSAHLVYLTRLLLVMAVSVLSTHVARAESGSWQERTLIPAPDGASCSRPIDMDADGDLDVIVGLDEAIPVWLENVDGQFQVFNEHVVSIGSFEETMEMDVADFNGDGFPDYAFTAAKVIEDGLVCVVLNHDGGSSFTLVNLFAYNSYDADLRVGDIDGDGDADIACYGISFLDSENLGHTLWLENGGDGLQWTQHLVDLNDEYRSVFGMDLADLDGDGHLDIIVQDHATVWFRNVAGDGSTWDRRVVDPAGARGDVRAADIDGDGDMGFAATDEQLDLLKWWENVEGDGDVFDLHEISPLIHWFKHLAVADWDGNGAMDIAACSDTGDRIDVWTNLGDGSEFYRQFMYVRDSPHDVWFADLDADGGKELLVACIGSSDEDRAELLFDTAPVAPPFRIRIVPHETQVIPPGGGWLQTRLLLTNHEPGMRPDMTIRVDTVDPVGLVYGPFLEETLTLKPFMTVQAVPFQIYVPDGRLPGTYQLRAWLQSPLGVTAADSIQVVVQSD